MTPKQIDAALERVPAGISAMAGDLTDDEDRATAVAWLWRLYQRAESCTAGTTAPSFTPETPQRGLEADLPGGNLARYLRDSGKRTGPHSGRNDEGE